MKSSHSCVKSARKPRREKAAADVLARITSTRVQIPCQRHSHPPRHRNIRLKASRPERAATVVDRLERIFRRWQSARHRQTDESFTSRFLPPEVSSNTSVLRVT